MSETVPLQACPDIEVWWHLDDGQELGQDAKPAARSLAATLPAPMTAAPAAGRLAAKQRQDRATAIDAVAVTASPSPSRRSAGRTMLALVLGLSAVGLTVVGLTINTRFAASFGQTAEAAFLLAAIGLVIDLLAIALPSAAAQLWRDRNMVSSSAAWAIWMVALGMTLLAAIGFAATNIGDGVAGRSRLVAEASALTADMTRLRAERAGIAEGRSVATIEAEIQRAQPAAAAVWNWTAGCTNVTLATSGAACADVLRLRQALGVAQRRDALDAELRAAEARLAPLPAIVIEDPQATMAADILAWISVGHVKSHAARHSPPAHHRADRDSSAGRYRLLVRHNAAPDCAAARVTSACEPVAAGATLRAGCFQPRRRWPPACGDRAGPPR